jgi:DNA repair protein RadC
MGWCTELLTWLQRATGIGYLHLPPLNEEPERKNQVEATKRVQENALSLLREISRCLHKNLAMSIEPKRGDDLGRITAVLGAVRPTFDRRQRLRQCLIKAGAENLPDYELLQVMLFTSNPHTDVEMLVQELLDRFGSLAEVLSAGTDALADAGLSLPAIAGVKFVREVALRFLRADLHQRPVVGSWDKLIDYCNAQIAYSEVEEFHILFLDRKNALIKDERQQRGTIDHTPVYTREVIKRALELGASALILVHNHPSGDPTPSAADIFVTNDIIKTAAALGIAVHDHLIIGRGGHTSLRDLELIPLGAKNTSAALVASLSLQHNTLHEEE